MNRTLFGTLPDGREVYAYTLKNQNGTTLEVIPFGCRIIKLLTKDRNGQLGDVVLGHRTLEEYYGNDFHGSFIGRYGNRIGNASFTLNGVTYQLEKNDGNNTLHGGTGGYHQVLWDVDTVDDTAEEPFIVFKHTSPDGDEGYPGALNITVRYTVSKKDEIVMEYMAEADQETIFNPTNHSFFNLSGNHQKDVLDTELKIFASKTTAVSDDLIPTGEILKVEGTPLDFQKAKKLGQDMFNEAHTIKMNGGFDHNYCVDGEDFRKMAEVYEPESGRFMEVYSCLPGIQLYTFNNAAGVNKDGSEMKAHSALCLETQFYPDSPNHSEFPFESVKPGEAFGCKTVYKFTVK